MVRTSDALRRALDIAASAVGLLVLSPLFAVIAAAIVLENGRPVFYRGRRVGRAGRPFYLLKFRTMVPDADRLGPAITAKGDPRVTRVGRWLRRTKLDELPQLLNVLRGEMSLVGPRPEDPKYVALYDADQRRVLSVRPGLTSPASLAFRDEEQRLAGEDWEQVYREQILPAKLAIDLEYLSRRTVASDLRLVLRTLRVFTAR